MTRKPAVAALAEVVEKVETAIEVHAPQEQVPAPSVNRQAYIESARFLCGTCGRNLYFNSSNKSHLHRIMSCGNQACDEFGKKYLMKLPGVEMEPLTE